MELANFQQFDANAYKAITEIEANIKTLQADINSTIVLVSNLLANANSAANAAAIISDLNRFATALQTANSALGGVTPPTA